MPASRFPRQLRGLASSLLVAAFAAVSLIPLAGPAQAMKIQTIKSPGGIEAWLVEEHRIPLMALRFAFEGGNAQDSVGKEGLANFMTAMMDEGAGELRSAEFQERVEDLAMRMNYDDSKDAFYGNFETLTANRDKSVELLRMAIQSPRFDTDAADRIRGQLLAGLLYAARDPDKVANEAWYALAFPNHPYGRPSKGTEASLKSITRDDLAAYHKRVFARSNLKVVAVGDITPEQLGKLLDDVFGGLPEKAVLAPVANAAPVTGGKQQVINMDVPQSVAMFGVGAMARKDPDFIPAFVLNQLVGGGGFASRLMEEVREKRGLAYSVYSYVMPFRSASVMTGGVATRNDAIGKSLELIRAELKNIAEQGPTAAEFDSAKSYLVGSYALRFDTNAKIATQLLGLLEEGFGPDYVENRNKMIDAVTMEDVKRVARRLYKIEDLIVTIVGKPADLDAKATGPKG